MTINNSTSNVNSTAKNLFYSYIPLGSEYVIYSESSNNTNQYDYIMLLKKPFEDQYETYEVVRQGTYNTYAITQKASQTIDEITVSNPYYCYSNITGQGIREVLPVHTELIAFSCLVVATLYVVKTMIGGVFKWSKRY